MKTKKTITRHIAILEDIDYSNSINFLSLDISAAEDVLAEERKEMAFNLANDISEDRKVYDVISLAELNSLVDYATNYPADYSNAK